MKDNIDIIVHSLYILNKGLPLNQKAVKFVDGQFAALNYTILRYLDINKVVDDVNAVETQFGVLLELTICYFNTQHKFYIAPSNYFAKYVTPGTNLFSSSKPVYIKSENLPPDVLQRAYKELCQALQNDTSIITEAPKEYFKKCLEGIYPDLKIAQFNDGKYALTVDDKTASIFTKQELKENWKLIIDNLYEKTA